ncbi:MAG: TIGR01777 family oxidoreductase, partial [Rhodothermales bacterium]|nr:TIGR01777 family oxidoreductase [Rhodothermales bacterium]
MQTFTRRTEMPVPSEQLFDWHDRRGAFERLTPPWQPVELARFEGIRDGQRAVIKLGPAPFQLTWIAEHQDYEAGRQFRDVQVKGPFAAWTHTHRMLPADTPGRSVLEDHVEYQLPLAPASEWLGGWKARREFERLFAYRHRVTRTDLAYHAAAGFRSRRIAITGSTGLLGSALAAFLTTGGHAVVRLVRSREAARRLNRSEQERASYWDPDGGAIDPAALEGVDAVVHLAGEPVYALRWSAEKKRRILQSRARGTRLLAEALARLERPPSVLLSASASGFYGSRGDSVLTEASQPGDGFLADVCRAWEDATGPAEAAGIRVCHLRIGVVLSPAGGFLKLALPAFRLGLGGTLGSGRQWVPWIALDDVLYA